jgi:hypothetical protein
VDMGNLYVIVGISAADHLPGILSLLCDLVPTEKVSPDFHF